jgi:putative transposase
MIEYKAKLAGITVERVDEAYTSQECPQCGHRQKPSGREYSCSSRSRRRTQSESDRPPV